ncbi:MAG TPA: BamA/TamA family outer membrane protein, partial [Paracoccaceae bacterium]|nr:BamA/TamA family outer membrane protein [Paracoccaceae bacterium]
MSAALLAGCASSPPELSGVSFEPPATAVIYDVRLEGMPNDEMKDLAEDALSIYQERDQGATSLALLERRAEGDLETIGQILRSYGYYDGSARVDVEDLPEEEYKAEATTSSFKLPSLSSLAFWRKKPETRDVEDVAKQYAIVHISVDPGPQFTLAEHDFQLIDPESGADLLPAESLGSPVGDAALAERIIAAETAATDQLHLQGYPYAEQIDRDAVADLELSTLEVETQFFSGPPSVFGDVSFEGLEDVEEDYLRTYIPWRKGDPVTRKQVQEFTRSLLATDLFSTAVVELPEDPPETSGPVALPVHVTTDERPFRTIAVSGEYSTDDGPGARISFEHRNLWGRNETANVEAIAGIDLQKLTFGYRQPQYRRPGQDLVAALTLVRELDDAFDETRATLRAGRELKVTDHWIMGYSGLLEASRIGERGGIKRNAYLAGLPVYAGFDNTDDLLNPTEGLRARLDMTPFVGTHDAEFTNFFQIDSNASTYWDFLGNGKYVLAGRARLGSILAAELDDIPKNRRLYSGGGGSVRGYARREVGPLDQYNDPIGGRSVAEASVEMRAKLYGELGGVLFADAGTVDRKMFPDFDHVQYAAGAGVRY